MKKLARTTKGRVRADALTALTPDVLKEVWGVDPEPEMLYVTCRAISSRINANYDAWEPEELKRTYHTFVGGPVFVEHHNWDAKKARGVILGARLHESKLASGDTDVWVELLEEIDARAFPRLADEILSGKINGVSMGADLKSTRCSVCGHRSRDLFDGCEHIYSKGEYFDVDGKEVLAFEYCEGSNFFENSHVEYPADESADILGVYLHTSTNKVAKLETLLRRPDTVNTLMEETNEPLEIGGELSESQEKDLQTLDEFQEYIDNIREEILEEAMEPETSQDEVLDQIVDQTIESPVEEAPGGMTPEEERQTEEVDLEDVMPLPNYEQDEEDSEEEDEEEDEEKGRRDRFGMKHSRKDKQMGRVQEMRESKQQTMKKVAAKQTQSDDEAFTGEEGGLLPDAQSGSGTTDREEEMTDPVDTDVEQIDANPVDKSPADETINVTDASKKTAEDDEGENPFAEESSEEDESEDEEEEVTTEASKSQSKKTKADEIEDVSESIDVNDVVVTQEPEDAEDWTGSGQAPADTGVVARMKARMERRRAENMGNDGEVESTDVEELDTVVTDADEERADPDMLDVEVQVADLEDQREKGVTNPVPSGAQDLHDGEEQRDLDPDPGYEVIIGKKIEEGVRAAKAKMLLAMEVAELQNEFGMKQQSRTAAIAKLESWTVDQLRGYRKALLDVRASRPVQGRSQRTTDHAGQRSASQSRAGHRVPSMGRSASVLGTTDDDDLLMTI